MLFPDDLRIDEVIFYTYDELKNPLEKVQLNLVQSRESNTCHIKGTFQRILEIDLKNNEKLDNEIALGSITINNVTNPQGYKKNLINIFDKVIVSEMKNTYQASISFNNSTYQITIKTSE
jgi:hypothetical protein